MQRIATLAGDLFWSAVSVLVLLIVAVFLLRLLGRVAPGTASKIGALADPANA